MGYCGNNVHIDPSVNIVGIHNLYMYDNTIIFGGSTILCTRAKFIMKKNSGAADGLTVVTGEHMPFVGRWFRDITDEDKDRLITGKSYDNDVIVEEDVLITTNVTLLSGIVVGRGAIIGSGSVCRFSIPPYAIVIGNPAKVVGFRFSPKLIIEHEKVLYPKEERLSLEDLEKNYKKYFLERIPEITKFARL
ncbi:MAG TPA: galactoside O-acetyltransferase [Ignavibacteria bacterium]